MPFFTGIQTPQLGDFVVLPIQGLSGMLIDIGEWLNGDGFGDYDHAEIYVGQPDKQAPLGYTFAAYPEGATVKPLPDYKYQTGWLWSTGHFYLSDTDRKNLVDHALALKATPYSALDYFALAAHRLHLPIPFLKEYIASTKHMICSQLVDYVYMEAGIHLFQDNRWPGYVTPADLAHLLVK